MPYGVTDFSTRDERHLFCKRCNGKAVGKDKRWEVLEILVQIKYL